MKTNHQTGRVLPVKGIQANGYIKGHDRKLNKIYRAMFNFCGTPRIARRKFRTATWALGYGKRAAERYQRVFGQPQPDQIVETA